MSDTGIGKTRLNRVTSAYQEIKKKKKILGTSQTCSRHGSDMPGMSQTRDSMKKILIFTPGPLPTIDQTKSLQPLSHSLSLPLTLSASLSCFPLGLPSRISLQRRLATNGAPLTSMSPKLHRLVSISLAPSVPESGAWPRFSLLYFLFLFFGFLRLGSLSLFFFFLIRVLVFSLAFYFRCDLLFSICSCDLFFLVYLFVLLFSLAFVVTYFICCDLLAGCEQFVYLVFI